MRKRNILKLAVPVVAASFLLLFITACTGDPPEPKCGEAVENKVTWTPASIEDPWAYSYYDGFTAIYEFATDILEPICPKVHVRVGFEVEIKSEFTHLFTLDADVTYGFFWEYPVTGWDILPVDNGYTRYSAQADFGLRSAFNDEEDGWMLPYIALKFPSWSEEEPIFEETDEEFFRNNVRKVTIEYLYYLHKE
jgi:hypothetical protein